MPTIINTSYFQNEPLFIPNSVEVPDMQDGNPTGIGSLNMAIARYEPLLLANALGVAQYGLLMAGLSDASGKWYDLLNGKTYDGKIWLGLKNENSLIAYYVYHKYLTSDRMQYTTVGLERSMSKNSIAVNPTEKLTEVWNIFIEMYGGVNHDRHLNYGYFWPHSYDPVYGFNHCENNNTAYVSLYKFLSDFPEDYTTNHFKHEQVKNRWGL